jgi:hypothetical protein
MHIRFYMHWLVICELSMNNSWILAVKLLIFRQLESTIINILQHTCLYT